MRKLRNNELGRISVSEFKNTPKTPIIVVLDNIRSLNNIGSVFRTSDAFLVEKIYLCGITATPPHREIHKTALGATESVDWEYKEDTLSLVRALKSEGITVASIEQVENSVMLDHFSFESNKKLAIVFGNEVKGVQQDVVSESDYCIEIPQKGTKHSLNISVSCGVVLWDLSQKNQNLVMLYENVTNNLNLEIERAANHLSEQKMFDNAKFVKLASLNSVDANVDSKFKESKELISVEKYKFQTAKISLVDWKINTKMEATQAYKNTPYIINSINRKCLNNFFKAIMCITKITY